MLQVSEVPKPRDPRDPIISIFCKEEIENFEKDPSTRNLYINITAFSLGIPRESNHVYVRVFAPEKLRRIRRKRSWRCCTMVSLIGIVATNAMNLEY